MLRLPIALLLSLAMPLAIADAAENVQPHIIVILADDMGQGDAGCFNEDSKILTPNIDRLAKEGMRFTDAHAPASVCVPSRYGLLTGRFPFRANVQWAIGRSSIEEGRMTVGSLLQSQGYHTACVGKWHLGFASDHPTEAGRVMPGGPLDRGFDQYFGIWASLDIPPYYYVEDDRCVLPPSERCESNFSEGWTNIQGAFWRGGGVAPGFKHLEVLPTFAEKAVGYIDDHAKQRADEPLFLYFPLPAPHTPWLPTEEYEGKSNASMYGDFTAQVDGVVGQVLDALDRNGMADDALVIFSSDNGPVWYEEDEQRLGHHSTGQYRGMKGDLWEGGHRMPFVARWPGQVEAGTTSGQTICFTDLLPTVADIVDEELPSDAGEDGVSFLPVLLDVDVRLPERTLIHTRNNVLAVRRGPWKLIPQLGSAGFSKPKKEQPTPGGPTGQLYNLDDDPGETTNLWLEKPELVKELLGVLDAER